MGEPGELISSGPSWPWSSVGESVNELHLYGFSLKKDSTSSCLQSQYLQLFGSAVAVLILLLHEQLAPPVHLESRVLRAKGVQSETKESWGPQDSQLQNHNSKVCQTNQSVSITSICVCVT